ncbi:T9SS type A sorting domain-containing protein, partial [candidate division KSB1 bacterium]|nr:T9SS type A sorting domain-containing protein [candidate division KSB1 bacterium]
SGNYLCTVRTSFGLKSVQFFFQNKNEQVPEANEIEMDWTETGELEQAFLVSVLAPVNDEIIYAATAVHSTPERNIGQVFKSFDGGENWEPTAPLEASWSISSLMAVDENILLAGGIALFEDQAHGIIYRTEDGGQSWHIVFEFPEGVVTDFIRTHDDHILAATGWNGMVVRSPDNGGTWEPFAMLGEHVQINALFQASNGVLFAGIEMPDNIGMIMRSENGEEWQPVEGIEGISAIYDVMEMDDKLFAAARGHDMGWVLQSDLDGVNWFKTTEFPDTEIQAVHCLMADEEGKLYAGLEMRQGPSFSRVFYRNPNEEQWLEFGSKIDLATTVFSLAKTNHAIFAGTGYIYGNIYKYSLMEIGIDEDAPNSMPRDFALLQNYPNPFNPHTLIRYRIADKEQPISTKIEIYDIKGRHVITLVNEEKQSGEYSVLWDGKNSEGYPVSNGIYLCTMKAGAFSQHRRLVLLK